MTIQFNTDVATALEFFERIGKLPDNLQNDEESRIGIMKDMIREGYNIAVFQTSRTPEQIAKDASKHGSVLYYKLGGLDEPK